MLVSELEKNAESTIRPASTEKSRPMDMSFKKVEPHTSIWNAIFYQNGFRGKFLAEGNNATKESPVLRALQKYFRC